ncbi:MAG: AAA family ATPase, partial [Lachnospiraceae bacterium]|nr:AAA family ATPase [Lachnospiraceae bacterium]
MDYLKRSMEDIIRDSAKTRKAVLVTGARQSGKSTLLKKLYPNRAEVTFDDPYEEDQARNNPEMFMMLHEPPVMFDEVQYVPELFRYIKMKCDASEVNGLFMLSGSQPFHLMELASESLA